MRLQRFDVKVGFEEFAAWPESRRRAVFRAVNKIEQEIEDATEDAARKGK